MQGFGRHYFHALLIYQSMLVNKITNHVHSAILMHAFIYACEYNCHTWTETNIKIDSYRYDTHV